MTPGNASCGQLDRRAVAAFAGRPAPASRGEPEPDVEDPLRADGARSRRCMDRVDDPVRSLSSRTRGLRGWARASTELGDAGRAGTPRRSAAAPRGASRSRRSRSCARRAAAAGRRGSGIGLRGLRTHRAAASAARRSSLEARTARPLRQPALLRLMLPVAEEHLRLRPWTRARAASASGASSALRPTPAPPRRGGRATTLWRVVSYDVSVIGLGRVGLPLALRFADPGCRARRRQGPRAPRARCATAGCRSRSPAPRSCSTACTPPGA